MNVNKLNYFLDSLHETYKVPGGELRIVKNGKEQYHYIFGDRILPENAGKDFYWFYSMSKVYTMTAVMQLIERNIVSLDTKLTDIFPGLLKIDSVIEKTTLRNLMSMTGGLNYNYEGAALDRIRRDDPNCFDPDRIVEAIYQDALMKEPGQEFTYSLCHDICGAVIWKVTGLPLDQYMKKYIFDPLEITEMGFFPKEEEKKRFIQQYRKKEGKIFERIDENNQIIITKKFASGGAGLYGNLISYMKLAEALSSYGMAANGYQVLKPESIHLLRSDQLTPMGLGGQLAEKFVDHRLECYSYALGVRTKIVEDGSSPIGEFGWDGAAGGYILMDTENKLTVGYLQHTLDFGEVYGKIHPAIRRLVYED